MKTRNAILHGDCITLMQRLQSGSVDFILTDPPYLVSYHDRTGRTVANDDNAEWLKPAFLQMHRVLKEDSLAVSFYSWNRVDRFVEAWRLAGFRIVGHLVFAKPYATSGAFFQYTHEQAYLLAKGRPSLPEHRIADILPWDYTGNRLHPTQKPIRPLKSLIEALTHPGELVLDPFCGSGSTLVAARDISRDFLGMELDPRHCLSASLRLHDAI